MKVINQSYGRGAGAAGAAYVARGLGLCPPEWQPALQWYWLRHLGLQTDAPLSPGDAKRVAADPELHDAQALVAALINYPIDQKPADPGSVMPHFWKGDGRGFYAFRSNWSDTDGIVAQIYGKSGYHTGWSQSEGGCFQIYGLGRRWIQKDNDIAGKTGTRIKDNVVLLPEDATDAGASARVTYAAGDAKTGSGCVTYDMSALYTAPVKGDDDEAARSSKAAPTAIRSFAADYSGNSTAPGLFAVVDNITVGTRKVWVGNFIGDLSTDANTFTITQGDATLKGTIISPANSVLEKNKPMTVVKDSHIPDATPSLQITSPDGKSGQFFVVMTLQKGAAPAVKSTGEGLDAKVTVAAQTIQFDGQKIIVGNP